MCNNVAFIHMSRHSRVVFMVFRQTIDNLNIVKQGEMATGNETGTRSSGPKNFKKPENQQKSLEDML